MHLYRPIPIIMLSSPWLPILDRQLHSWSGALARDVKLSTADTNRVASAIASEVAALDPAARFRLRAGDPVPLESRLEELRAFQAFMDWAAGVADAPPINRAQVLVQNYVCFVYLPDSCYRALRKELPSASVGARCCRFLDDNPVRAFRNAVAHANWHYLTDFSGLRFYVRKGADPSEPLVEWTVSQEQLNFWQTLARATAYAAYEQLRT